jgi:hypothetical protein
MLIRPDLSVFTQMENKVKAGDTPIDGGIASFLIFFYPDWFENGCKLNSVFCATYAWTDYSEWEKF